MPQSYAPLLNIVNNFHPFKQRVSPQAFALSCLLHLAAGTVIFFVARKFAFEQWPSMGPKSDDLNVVQMELLTASAAPVQPIVPPVKPPSPEPAVVPLEEPPKIPETKPELAVKRPSEMAVEKTPVAEQTAQVAQAAAAPSAQVTAAEPLTGQGRGDINWRMLAIAKVSALVEREKYYPPAAQKAGYTGRVSVHIRLEPDGTVSSYEIKELRGHPMFGRAVETAMGKIKSRNIGLTLPERFEFLLPVEFELK